MEYWKIGILGRSLFAITPLIPTFHYSNPSFRSSPRFDRDLLPSLLANNFQWIDARQHFVRDGQAFGKRFTQGLGAVEAGLGRYVALRSAGIERRSVHSREQYQGGFTFQVQQFLAENLCGGFVVKTLSRSMIIGAHQTEQTVIG